MISSTPAAGSVVTGTPPTTFSLTFSEPIDPTSIVASDFTVDGIGADSASLSADGLTITYTFNTSPVTTQGSETMSLPAGSVKGADDETGNVGLLRQLLLRHQPAPGHVHQPAGRIGPHRAGHRPGRPVQQGVQSLHRSTRATSSVSQGTVVSAVPLTSQSVDLTLSGVTQDGTLTLTVPAGAILDQFGVPQPRIHRHLHRRHRVGTLSHAAPGQDPAGSLIYDPSVSGSVGFVGDTDTYTLPLAAGQTLSLVLTTDPSLIGTITLLDPSGNTIASATAAGAGANAVLETAPITTAGTYSLVVSGSGGTTGGYTLQAILNAVYKPATDTNNSIALGLRPEQRLRQPGHDPVRRPRRRAGDHRFLGRHRLLQVLSQRGPIHDAGRAGTQRKRRPGLCRRHRQSPGPPRRSQPQSGRSTWAEASAALPAMTLNGIANISGSNLDLTDGELQRGGQRLHEQRASMSARSRRASISRSRPTTIPLADGFTFTIQGNSPNALGVRWRRPRLRRDRQQRRHQVRLL